MIVKGSLPHGFVVDVLPLSKQVCTERGFKSIIAVSEPYHTRRAHYTFNKVFKGTGITVTMYPVQDSWYTSSTWWKTEEGLLATTNEYVKGLYYLVKGYI